MESPSSDDPSPTQAAAPGFELATQIHDEATHRERLLVKEREKGFSEGFDHGRGEVLVLLGPKKAVEFLHWLNNLRVTRSVNSLPFYSRTLIVFHFRLPLQI